MHAHATKMALLLAVGFRMLPLISALSFGTLGPWLTVSSTPGRPRRRSGLDTVPPHIQRFCHDEAEPPIYTGGDDDAEGPGIFIANFDKNNRGSLNGTMYFVYESNHDFVPYKYTIIPPMGFSFISVCPTFEGRVVRGDYTNLDGQKHMLGTWAEVNVYENGSSWGDISLLQGNDGAAIIQSLDGLDRVKGFTLDVLSTGAPDSAWAQKATGSWCLDKIDGPRGNNVTREWEKRFLDPWSVYLEDDINPVINSNNGRFKVYFYDGVV